MTKKKKLIRYSILLLSLIVVAELVLRLVFDLGAKPLYMKDEHCEYRMVPNQDISRFHNDFVTNSYGMRSPEVSEKDGKRILLFGDSVVNGGSKVDQSELMSSILIEKLSELNGTDVNVCNISAASWGPENAFEYYKNHVDFEFDMMVLVFSTHDYHDNMHFRDVVGVQPAWPDRHPLTAIGDVFYNFVIPKIKGSDQYDYLEGFDDSPVNPGWQKFIDESNKVGVPLIVYVHPESSELSEKKWNKNGEGLVEMLDTSRVRWINGMEIENEEIYLDNIHLSSEGHALLAESLFGEISKVDW